MHHSRPSIDVLFDAVALAYGAESPEGMKLAIDTYFTPLLLGANANAVPAIMARLNTAIQDNRFAKSAVETALFDALGKRTGLPVSHLLGGRMRDSLPVAWTLASGNTAKDIDEAEPAEQRALGAVGRLRVAVVK